MLVLIDDQAGPREALAHALRAAHLQIAGTARSVETAADLHRHVGFDLALVCARTDSAARRLGREVAATTGVGIVLYAQGDDLREIAAAFDEGVRGAIARAAPLDELVRALHHISSGATYRDPRLTEPRRRFETGGHRPLSPREREALGCVAEGATIGEVGERLGVSEETARTLLRRGAAKLGARTRAQAVAVAYARGELAPVDVD
ncbi:MAG: LuxR C-terminal-related transcriptional regulator [Solirubrobacteraceae bacterium]